MGQSSQKQMLLEVLDRLSLSVDSLREESQQQTSNLERKINCLSEAVLGLFELVTELALQQERVGNAITDYMANQIIKEVFECPQEVSKLEKPT